MGMGLSPPHAHLSLSNPPWFSQVARYQSMVEEAQRARDAKAAELESMQSGLATLTADMQV